ncbi:hypothetical protein RJF_5183 [Candidozyma auris]
MVPPTFLALSNDISEPFVIPGVSPTSPKVSAASPTALSPVSDATVGRERAVSIIELS